MSPSTSISVKAERQAPGATLNRPLFLSQYDMSNGITAAIITYTSTLTFIIESLVEVHYLRQMLNMPELQGLWDGVRKVDLPGFYWFSGITRDRKLNESLELLASLPNLEEVTLTLHTAGFTASMHTERERARLEGKGEISKSKELKVLRMDQVVQKYDLSRLLYCQKLKAVNMVLLTSEHVQYWSRPADPVSPFRDLKYWIEASFEGQVTVNQVVR